MEREFRQSSFLYAAFTSIFLSEIGDKTQLSTIMLAAKFNVPVEVILGSISALALVTSLGVISDTKRAERLPQNILQEAVESIFIAIGILTILGLSFQQFSELLP